MILTEFVNIKTKYNNQVKYYKKLGYDTSLESINIPVSILNKSSRVLIKAKCEYCNNIVDVTYNSYVLSVSKGGYFCCGRKCSIEKRKNTNLERYGVEIPIQCKEIFNKIKNTNLERYGVEYASQSNEIKESIKETNLEKYGSENVFQSEEIKNKIKKTNLEKLGYSYPTQSNIVKNKIKETNLEKYGGTGFESELINNKIKETNIERYDIEFASKNKNIKDKIKKKNLEKYGSENVFQSLIIKKKIKKSNLEKYGVEFISQNQDIKDQVRKTNLEKYNGFGFESKYINEKIKQSILDKYGVEFASQNQDIKNKIKEVNIEKYGVDNIEKSDSYRRKYNICNHPNYIKYVGNKTSLFSCDKFNHLFEIDKDNYYNRLYSNIPLCTICYPIGDNSSIKEKELLNYISSIYNGNIISGYKDKLEIDIYLPDLKIGFEFNGLYWHSNEYKEKNYHLDKLNYFKSKGIRIIYIWEDTWDKKREIIKSQILNWLNLNNNKIYARKTTVSIVDDITLIKKFLNNNHIQGWVASNIKIGLFFNDELVSLMTFDKFEGRKKMKDGEWNLSRLCSKLNTNVIGASSKMLNFFIKKYDPKRIISFSDKEWSDGNVYYKLGFKKLYESEINYKYIINGERKNKQNYRKKKLIKRGYDKNLSEIKIMESIGIKRVYDCGQMKFELLLK